MEVKYLILTSLFTQSISLSNVDFVNEYLVCTLCNVDCVNNPHSIVAFPWITCLIMQRIRHQPCNRKIACSFPINGTLLLPSARSIICLCWEGLHFRPHDGLMSCLRQSIIQSAQLICCAWSHSITIRNIIIIITIILFFYILNSYKNTSIIIKNTTTVTVIAVLLLFLLCK